MGEAQSDFLRPVAAGSIRFLGSHAAHRNAGRACKEASAERSTRSTKGVSQKIASNRPHSRIGEMPPRLYSAFAAYGAIAVLALFTLRGQFRIAVLILLGGLALKTWIAARSNR